MLALLPSQESTYIGDYERLIGGGYLLNEQVGYERLTEAARQAGAVVVDLTDAFSSTQVRDCISDMTSTSTWRR